MGSIAVIGGGGHAKVIISILLKLNKYEVIGYIDKENRGTILGINYIGNDDLFINKYKNKIKYTALGVGQIKTSKLRKTIVGKYLKSGFLFPKIVSPDATINKEVNIGNGTVVMDGVVINSGAEIGEYAIINSNSTVEHDCKIGDYVHIAPGVTMSGEVNVGNDCLIGVGSTIIQGISISSNVIVGAGSIVYKDITLPGVYLGNPLRKIK